MSSDLDPLLKRLHLANSVESYRQSENLLDRPFQVDAIAISIQAVDVEITVAGQRDRTGKVDIAIGPGVGGQCDIAGVDIDPVG